MKKVFLALFLFSLLFIMSCGEDDGGTVTVDVNGTVQIGGQSVSITNGLFGEYTEEGAYGATFIISDGPITYNSATDEASFEGDHLISVVIASAGDSFEAGTYPLDFTATKGALVITVNSSSEGLIGSGGSVEVSGSGNVFTLSFNVDLQDQSKLTGSVSGAFEVINIELEEEEEEEEEAENEIIFDGTSYEGTDGLLVDVGVEANIAPDHYTRKFAIANGAVSYESTGNFSISTSASFALIFGASSLGTGEFKTGEFQFRPSAGSVPDANFFFSGMFKANGVWTSINGGTMTISGTSPDYTVELDITLNGGKTVTGAFVGTFDVE